MRILATLFYAFAAAIFAAQYLLPEWLYLYAASGCVVLGVLWALALRENGRRRALLIGFGLALGFVFDLAYLRVVYSPFEALFGKTETMVLELADYPTATQYGCRAEVRIQERGLRGKAIYYGDAALLDLEPGMHITGRVEARSAANIRGRNVTSNTSRGVYVLLYNRGPMEIETGRAGSRIYSPQRMVRRVQSVIAECFPERTQPFMNALLLGDRDELSEEDGVWLSEAGLYHVTAVSGMHCAFLVALIIFVVGRYLRFLLCAISIPLLVFYAFMVGMTPSVVRACVMLILALIAPFFKRDSDPLTSMSIAMLLILLQNPFAVKSVSLQLSFAAMAGLITLTPRLIDPIRTRIWPPDRESRVHRRRTKTIWKMLRRQFIWVVLSSLATTAGAMLFTIPLSAFYFNTLTLASPLSNLFGLWAVSATFVSGFLTVLLGLVYPPAAAVAAYIPHAGAMFLLSFARLVAGIPWHAAYFSNRLLVLWLVYVYAMFSACRLLRGRTKRWLVASLLAVLTLALTICLNVWKMNQSALHVVALDVGQGQCVALYSRGSAALVDCGSSSYGNAGETAADYLQSIGVNRLDYIVLSHYHGDHCNGLPVLLSRLGVGMLLVPDIEQGNELRDSILKLAEKWHVPVYFVRETAHFELGEAALTVFPPVVEEDAVGDENEECLTVLCTKGSFDALFTGDMDADTEYRLIAEYPLPDVEVLMAGHHGSRYSTGGDLLAEVKPETCVVSCGAGNSYGHPHLEALRRMTEAGAQIYRTDRQGTIHVSVAAP